MNTIKLTKQDNHQFLEIPQEYEIQGQEVYLKRVGNILMLIPVDNPWQTFFDSLDLFSDDFMNQREQPEQQARETLFE